MNDTPTLRSYESAAPDSESMRVRFLGPLGQVTGSCALLECTSLGVRFLVDCGIAQGDRIPAYQEQFPVEPSTLDFVLLTHAHTDHCGFLPQLVSDGFDGPVYCTEETAQLVREMLRSEWAGEEVDTVAFRGLDPLKEHSVSPGITIAMYPAGHILGAVSFRIAWASAVGQGAITFSGDVGAPDPCRGFALIRRPVFPPPADYVVVESTYGGRNRPSGVCHLTSMMGEMAELIDEIQRTGGILLLPAFALERTQTLTFVLNELYRCDPVLARVPLYLHSPLAIRLGTTYAAALGGGGGKVACPWLGAAAFRQLGLDPDNWSHRRALQDYLAGLFGVCEWPAGVAPAHVSKHLPEARRSHAVVGHDELGSMRDGGPAVIVVSGGMVEHGSVLHYLDSVLRRADSIVALAGYASPKTLGGKLLEMTDVPPDVRAGSPLQWSGGPEGGLPRRLVAARVARVGGYSGHGAHDDLLRWQHRRARRRVFIQHGDNQARYALRKAILSEGHAKRPAVEVPHCQNGWFNLDSDRWEFH